MEKLFGLTIWNPNISARKFFKKILILDCQENKVNIVSEGYSPRNRWLPQGACIKV